MDLEKYNEIVNNDLFKREKNFLQHGDTSVYEHSIHVARTCFVLSNKLGLEVDRESLIKGALLHDYFLYDWHEKDKSHQLHGFTHPRTARNNAVRDFHLNKIEENMILSHMFPLGCVIPNCKESWILCITDKYCALREITLFKNKILFIRLQLYKIFC